MTNFNTFEHEDYAFGHKDTLVSVLEKFVLDFTDLSNIWDVGRRGICPVDDSVFAYVGLKAKSSKETFLKYGGGIAQPVVLVEFVYSPSEYNLSSGVWMLVPNKLEEAVSGQEEVKKASALLNIVNNWGEQYRKDISSDKPEYFHFGFIRDGGEQRALWVLDEERINSD